MPALLVIATLLVHGWSLGDGLFLDDHWHQAQLRERGWSLDLLFDATTIEPARFVHMWWQDKPAVWRYARPVSVALMKLVCDVSGGSAFAQHVVSVGLHLLTVWMVYRLCLMLTGHRGWSTVGGLLFAVYVHSIFAVGWIASQNGVLQTCLCVGALMAYLRGSGLRVGPDAAGDSANAPRWRWIALAWLLWLLALGSRENAVVMPVIFVAFELAYRRRSNGVGEGDIPVDVEHDVDSDRVSATRQHCSRAVAPQDCSRAVAPRPHALSHVLSWPSVSLVLMSAVATAFAWWRLAIYAVPMPDVYVRRPDGDLLAFAEWCSVKLLHYVCSAVWHSPMTIGPSGRLDPVREVPGDCLLMLGIVGVMAFGYVQATRGLRGRWIWPLWIILSLLPVTHVLATPHSGYMAGVGFAVATVFPAALARSARPVGIGRCAKGVAIFFLIATCSYTPIYRALWTSMVAAERITIEEWALAGPPPPTVTDVFLINVPFVNIYAGPCMSEAWRSEGGGTTPSGGGAIRTHVLTFAPDLLHANQPCTLRQIDDHTIEVTSAGKPWFSGLLGRFLIDGLRENGRLQRDQVIVADPFITHVVDAGQNGIRAIRFRFKEPLSSPGYQFYFTSPVCSALPLRFGKPRKVASDSLESTADSPHNAAALLDRLRGGRAAAAVGLFDLLTRDPDALAGRREEFDRLVGDVARSVGADAAPRVAESGSIDVVGLSEWWTNRVDDRILAHVSMARDTLAPWRRRRDRLAAIRSAAARIIRTDLYLTGPPYDVSNIERP